MSKWGAIDLGLRRHIFTDTDKKKVKMNFTIEKQWQDYLERSQVKESDLSPIQCSEMKKAFFGGALQLLFLVRDDVSKLSEKTACLILDKIVDEGKQFWLNEVRKCL